MNPSISKKKSAFKIFWWCVSIIIILILCVIALLPTYFSTQGGNAFIMKWMNKRISGSISIEEAKFSWLGDQGVKGFVLFDKQGKKILSFKEFKTTRALLTLLFYRDHWGKTYLDSPMLHLINQGNGKLNIEESLAPPDKEKKRKVTRKKFKAFSIPTQGEMVIQNGMVEIEGPRIPEITLFDLNFTLYGKSESEEAILHLTGDTVQGGTEGEIFITAKIPQRKSLNIDLSSGVVTALEKIAPLYMMAKIKAFPVAVFDELLTYDEPALSGIFLNAIGNTLDIETELTATKEEIKIDAKLNAQNLKGILIGHTQDQIFYIDSASELKLTINPAFFNQLLSSFDQEPSWHLGEKTMITIDIENFFIPLPFEVQCLSFSIKSTIDRIELAHKTLGTLSLSDFRFDTQSKGLSQELVVDYSFELKTTKAPSKSEGHLDLSDLFDLKGKLSILKSNLNFKGKASTIPLDAIGVVFGQKADLTPYLGPWITLSFSGQIQQGIGNISLQVISPILETSFLEFTLDPSIKLSKEASIVYKIAPPLLMKYFPYKEEIRVLSGGELTWDIIKFEFPVAEKTGIEWDKLSFISELSMPQLRIQGISGLTSLEIKNFEGKCTVSGSDHIEILFKTTNFLTDAAQISTMMMGPQTNLIFSAQGSLIPFSISTMALKGENEHYVFDLRGKIDEQGIFSLTRPASSKLTVTPESFERWAKTKGSNPPVLLKPVVIESTQTTLEFKAFPLEIHTLQSNGTTTVSPLTMEQANIKGKATIKDLKMENNFNGKIEQLSIQMKGKTEVIRSNGDEKEEGKIDATLRIKQFLKEGELSLSDADFILEALLDDFPLFILDALACQDGKLVTLFGPNMTMNMRGRHTPKKEPRVVIDFTAEGEGFKADLAFSMDETFKILQDHSGYIHWSMTPTRYHTLMFWLEQKDLIPRTDYLLLNSTPISIVFSELSCPATPPPSIGGFLCQSGFIGTVQVGPMILVNQQTRDTFNLQGVFASIHGKNFSETLDLRLNSDFKIENASSGFIRLDSQLENIWKIDGTFNKEGMNAKGKLLIHQLPLDPFLALIPGLEKSKKQIHALTGPFLNADIHGNITALSGPLQIEVSASNLKASMPFMLRNGALTLQQKFSMEITLTQEVSENFLIEINPLLITAARSDHPLKLTIEPEGFMIPINPYTFTGVKIGKATLDIGQIWVKNGGELQSLMDFLKAKYVSKEGVMSAWFTPIYLNLNEGIAIYERFDALLAANVHIACWGMINHNDEKVKMVLAVAPSTLEQLLGISGLSRQDMFQIKMRGTIDHLQLDWKSASSRIAAIIARTKGGPPGFIVGGLIELMGGSLGEEKTPPPTMYPFPWMEGEAQHATSP